MVIIYFNFFSNTLLDVKLLEFMSLIFHKQRIKNKNQMVIKLVSRICPFKEETNRKEILRKQNHIYINGYPNGS